MESKSFGSKAGALGKALLVGLAILLLLRFLPFTSVSAGHVGVVTTFGKVDPDVLGEGVHLINPLSKVTELSTRIQKSETKSDAASRDLQQVSSSIALNYHIDANKAANFYQKVGVDYESNVISPAVEETLKAVTARYTAEELIAKREDVRNAIKSLLSSRLAARTYGGLVVDDFSITNFNFSPSFNAAIEAKQEAEQLALKAKRDLERIRIEAEQKVTQANAEAEALRAQKQQVTPELIQLRQIEVQRQAVAKWDGHLPNVNSGALPFLNLSKP